MQRVPHHRYMYRRGDKLIFRRGIPPYARAVFGGRREVQVSLRTAEVSQARHTLAIHLARFEKKLASARKPLRPPKQSMFSGKRLQSRTWKKLRGNGFPTA